MPLKYCLSISSLDPADAADVRALVRANGGDEAAGVQQYIDGIMRDVEELQAKVAPRTFNQSDEPFGPTSRENLTDKEREALAQIRAILRPPGYNEAVLAGGLEAARNVDPNDPRTFNQPAGSQDAAVALGALADKGNDEAIVGQALVDRGGIDPKQLPDVFIGISLGSEPDGLVSVPPLTSVMSLMRSAIAEDPKVLDAVVSLVPVDVVNMLFGSEASAKVALHDEAMLQNSTAFDAELPIPSAGMNAADSVRLLVGNAARSAAELLSVSLGSRREARKDLTAMFASQGQAFGQDSSSGPRASITFPAGGLTSGDTIIKLFETANLSSLLHESGHFFLEAFRTLAERADAPKAMKDDLAAINEWLGHESGAYGVDAQEKWARGFEAYTMEGKAPSLALADAFARFKQWLVQIYKTVRGLNVQLTPEIREVMDRMLATDEEIAQAREEANMNPLFTDAGAAGMSEADFRAYQRLARRSAEQAEQTLLEKTMAKIRREREAWYKDERKAVAAEVAATVNTRPEYRLIEAMANKVWINADGTTTEMPDMRFDREELVSRYSPGIVAELTRSKLGGNRGIIGTEKNPGNIGVEEAADFFGFRNADEMVRILQNTIKRKEFIVQETDKIMLDRYGDPFEDGSITEEAMAAIHSEQQAQTVAAEARQLAVRAGRPATNITARIFKARAQAMIGRMQVRQVRAARFLQAERQAARNAERAFARIVRTAANQRVSPEDATALAEAQRFKEQQLLNHYLYMEARDVEAYVKTGRERMRRYDRKSVRQKLDGGYIEQIDAILSDYDFRVVSQVALDRRESLLAFVTRMSTEAGVPVPGQFKEDGTPVLGEGREGDLAIDERLINEANRKHYSRLSVDELRGLFDTIANLDHLGRFKNELREKGRKRQLAESVSKVARQIETNIGTGKVEQNRGLRAGIRGYTNLLWSVDTMSVEYDGGEEVGTFYDEIKSSIDRGAVEEQRMGVEAATKMGEVFSVYSTAEIAAMKAKKVVEGGNGFAWSKLDILAAALNTGNRDNLERLLNPEVHETRRLTREQLDALLATLDKRDWDFVQSMWDLIDSYWPMLAEVELRRTGVKPQKVEAAPVETAFGRYRGGYYPIAYDSTLPGKAIVDEQSAFDKYNSAGHGARAAVKNGMTKQRQQTGGGRTLNLDLNVPMSHIRDTIRLITMSEAIDNTYRILNHGDVRDAFLNAGRRNDWEVLNLWLKDVAAGPIYNTDAINATARFIKTNFTMSRLAFNLKTIALQLTGIGQSAAVIGKRNMMQGIVDYSKRPAAVAAEVVAKSSFMAERQSTFQKDMHDFANDVRVMSPVASRYWKVLDAVGKIGFWPIQKMQFYGVDLPTWLGAYRDGLAKFNDETKAVAYADRMVARSQASGLMADRSSFERGTTGQNQRQSDFVRLWTTLGSYMLAKLNRARVTSQRGVVAVRHGDFVAAMNAAVDLMILYLAEGVMMGLAYSLMGDDDDEKDGSFAAFVATEAAGSVVGGVPFVREIASGLRGFDTGGVAGSALKIPVDIALQVGQGENDKGFRRALMDAVGVGTGLPTTQGLRIWEGLTDDQTPLSETLFGRNPLTR